MFDVSTNVGPPDNVNVTCVPEAVALKCSRIRIILSVVCCPDWFNVLIASNGNL